MLIDNVCIGALADAVDNRQKLNFKNQTYGPWALEPFQKWHWEGPQSIRHYVMVLAILFHFRCIDTAPEKQPSVFLSSLWAGRDSYDRQ